MNQIGTLKSGVNFGSNSWNKTAKLVSMASLDNTPHEINKQDAGALDDHQMEGNIITNIENNTCNNGLKHLSHKPTLVVLPAKTPEVYSTYNWYERKKSLMSWQNDVKYHINKAGLPEKTNVRIAILVANKLKTNPTIHRLQSDQTYRTITETIDWEKNVTLAIRGIVISSNFLQWC